MSKQTRIQLTKVGLKQHIHRYMEEDELLHLRKLADLGSESATVVANLKLERSIKKETFRVLRHEHPSQITLVTILCGSRFKHPFQGILFPTERQNRGGRREREVCGREDSLEHLLKCHGLEKYRETGPASVGFLVRMARRAIQLAPGVNIPKYLEKKQKP